MAIVWRQVSSSRSELRLYSFCAPRTPDYKSRFDLPVGDPTPELSCTAPRLLFQGCVLVAPVFATPILPLLNPTFAVLLSRRLWLDMRYGTDQRPKARAHTYPPKAKDQGMVCVGENG